MGELNKRLATTVKIMRISLAGMTGCLGLVSYHIYRLEKNDGGLEHTLKKFEKDCDEVVDLFRQHRIELENKNRKK